MLSGYLQLVQQGQGIGGLLCRIEAEFCQIHSLKMSVLGNIHLMSQCQNSTKFLSVSYLMKTADVIMNFFSSHNTTDHT